MVTLENHQETTFWIIMSMRITSFLLANAPRYYITQRNNESGQRKGLLNLVFLPVKIHSSRVTIERVCRVRVGEELREEALKNV